MTKRSTEQSAEPETIQIEAPVETLKAPTRPVEDWAKDKLAESEVWLYAAARVEGGWLLGQEVSEREFDEVITRTRNAPVGGI